MDDRRLYMFLLAAWEKRARVKTGSQEFRSCRSSEGKDPSVRNEYRRWINGSPSRNIYRTEEDESASMDR